MFETSGSIMSELSPKDLRTTQKVMDVSGFNCGISSGAAVHCFLGEYEPHNLRWVLLNRDQVKGHLSSPPFGHLFLRLKTLFLDLYRHSSPMATAASPSLSPVIVRGRKYKNPVLWRMHVRASDSSGGSSTGEKRKRRVDTRIHWSNPDEGWIGGKTTPKTENEKKDEILRGRFAELIDKSAASHYQLRFLGCWPWLSLLLFLFYLDLY